MKTFISVAFLVDSKNLLSLQWTVECPGSGISNSLCNNKNRIPCGNRQISASTSGHNCWSGPVKYPKSATKTHTAFPQWVLSNECHDPLSITFQLLIMLCPTCLAKPGPQPKQFPHQPPRFGCQEDEAKATIQRHCEKVTRFAQVLHVWDASKGPVGWQRRRPQQQECIFRLHKPSRQDSSQPRIWKRDWVLHLYKRSIRQTAGKGSDKSTTQLTLLQCSAVKLTCLAKGNQLLPRNKSIRIAVFHHDGDVQAGVNNSLGNLSLLHTFRYILTMWSPATTARTFTYNIPTQPIAKARIKTEKNVLRCISFLAGHSVVWMRVKVQPKKISATSMLPSCSTGAWQIPLTETKIQPWCISSNCHQWWLMIKILDLLFTWVCFLGSSPSRLQFHSGEGKHFKDGIWGALLPLLNWTLYGVTSAKTPFNSYGGSTRNTNSTRHPEIHKKPDLPNLCSGKKGEEAWQEAINTDLDFKPKTAQGCLGCLPLLCRSPCTGLQAGPAA